MYGYGLEVLHLLRDWERLQLRASGYKNHRIFTLRCIHKELVPISIKLKSTLKTEKAKKIVRKAEKDLLQARVKAINSILDNVSKQTEVCRSQLVSILSAQKLREYQGFIEKAGEIRFTKVKQRQINKCNNLPNKKGGNITRINSPRNLAVSQAGVHFPPGERSSLVASQAGSQASQAVTSQAGAHLPSREGSNVLLAFQAVHSQAGAHLPPREGSNLAATQAGRQVTSQAIVPLPPREGSSLAASQAGTHLPSREGGNSAITWSVPFPGDSTSSKAASEATTNTPARESHS